MTPREWDPVQRAYLDVEPEEPSRVCPDGASCHHGCADDAVCWRVNNAAPLGLYSGAWRKGRDPGTAPRPVAAIRADLEAVELRVRAVLARLDELDTELAAARRAQRELAP